MALWATMNHENKRLIFFPGKTLLLVGSILERTRENNGLPFAGESEAARCHILATIGRGGPSGKAPVAVLELLA